MKFTDEVLLSCAALSKAIAYQADSGSRINPKHLLRIFLRHDLSEFSQANSVVICNGSGADRKDYDEIYANLRKNFPVHTFIELKNKNLRFSFPRVGIFRAWAIWSLLRGSSFYQRIARFAYTVYILNSIAGLHKEAVHRVQCFVGFLPFVGLEGALAQLLNSRGARVLMIQHSLFDRDANYKPIDKLIYEPSSFVELLCWGSYSFRKLEGLPFKRLHIAGNLKSCFADDYTRASRPRASRIYVVLPAPVYEGSTERLVAMVKALAGITAVYRLHPSDTRTYPEIALSEIDNSGRPLSEVVRSKEFDVFISSNSTAYYDVYLFGGKCLNFVTDDSRVFVDIDHDQFGNLEELQARLTRQSQTEDLQACLTDLFGIGINNYRTIVESA
jgi:hypothetical protein